jgi:IMP dehydrogenase/GMP reductase
VAAGEHDGRKFVQHWVPHQDKAFAASRRATYNTDLIQGIKAMRVIQKALTFDDVLLIPAHSSVLPRDVSLQTKLTRNITLNIPLVSAAMDTVTEARLAIALAQEGGIGIVHKNLTPSSRRPKWPR